MVPFSSLWSSCWFRPLCPSNMPRFHNPLSVSPHPQWSQGWPNIHYQTLCHLHSLGLRLLFYLWGDRCRWWGRNFVVFKELKFLFTYQWKHTRMCPWPHHLCSGCPIPCAVSWRAPAAAADRAEPACCCTFSDHTGTEGYTRTPYRKEIQSALCFFEVRKLYTTV